MRHRPPSLYPVPRLAEGAVLLLEELFVVEAGDIVGRGASSSRMSSLSVSALMMFVVLKRKKFRETMPLPPSTLHSQYAT